MRVRVVNTSCRVLLIVETQNIKSKLIFCATQKVDLPYEAIYYRAQRHKTRTSLRFEIDNYGLRLVRIPAPQNAVNIILSDRLHTMTNLSGVKYDSFCK